MRIFLSILCLSLLLCGCSQASQAPGISGGKPLEGVYTLSTADQKVSHDSIRDMEIPEDAQVLITEPGAYRFSGIQDGQICVDVQDEIVYLILDGLDLHSNEGPAIHVKSAAKVVITVPEGSVSTLSDSVYYGKFPDAQACVFSASDLTINGGGTLQVNGYFEDGIRSKDVLKVLDITASLRSKGDGLRGNDGVVIENSQLDLQCEGTGILTTRSNKPGRGFAAIQGGSLSIIAGAYGIQTTENLYILNCQTDIYGVIDNLSVQGESQVQEG